MAESVASLNTKLDTLQSSVDAERVEVLAKLKEIRDSIPAGPATQEELDALGVRVDTEIARVQGIVNAAD